MTITATTGSTTTGSTATTTSAAASAQSQLSVDYENFLQLLTAQIQNQDPLEPMDSTQFVSQLAQLSQVEQAVQTNSNLETLNGSMSSLSGMSSLNMLGRQVSVASNKIELASGAGATTYELASTAASVSATISDANGTVVRTLSGLSTESGSKIALDWDGLSDSGTQLADGIYTVTINAVDAAGSTISYDTYPTTAVQQVLFGTDGETLKLSNGETVSASEILSAQS